MTIDISMTDTGIEETKQVLFNIKQDGLSHVLIIKESSGRNWEVCLFNDRLDLLITAIESQNLLGLLKTYRNKVEEIK